MKTKCPKLLSDFVKRYDLHVLLKKIQKKGTQEDAGEWLLVLNVDAEFSDTISRSQNHPDCLCFNRFAGYVGGMFTMMDFHPKDLLRVGVVIHELRESLAEFEG